MQKERQVKRSVNVQSDGERRWQSAYQLLWQWSQAALNPAEAEPSVEPDGMPLVSQEIHHADSPLCTRLDQHSGAKTDD